MISAVILTLSSPVAFASPEEDLVAIIRERDGILLQFVLMAEAGRSHGVMTEEDVRKAKLKLFRFRRDSASTLEEKAKNQELIVQLVQKQGELIKMANRDGIMVESEVLVAREKLLTERQLLAELRIEKKNGEQ